MEGYGITSTSASESGPSRPCGRARKIPKHFADAAIGFAMTTPDGRFVDANPAYCLLTGYSSEELRTLGFPQLIHQDDFAANMEQISGCSPARSPISWSRIATSARTGKSCGSARASRWCATQPRTAMDHRAGGRRHRAKRAEETLRLSEGKFARPLPPTRPPLP